MPQDPLHLLCIEPRFPGRLGAVADWLVRRRGYRCQFYCHTAEPQPRPDKPIFLTVKADLTLALGEITIARETLGGALAGVTKGDKDTRIFLRADKTVPYGELMEVMNLLRAGGYLKVALVGMEKASTP